MNIGSHSNEIYSATSNNDFGRVAILIDNAVKKDCVGADVWGACFDAFKTAIASRDCVGVTADYANVSRAQAQRWVDGQAPSYFDRRGLMQDIADELRM